MKLYSKIAGITLTILGLCALICLIIGILEQNNIDDKVMLSLLFIPCLIHLHFMYIHNFGFNLKTEIPIKNFKIILILTILSLVISIIVPAGYLLSEINLESKANNMVNRGKDSTTNLELKATLKTKFESGKLMYVINISRCNNKALDLNNYQSFSFGLYDKDGFIIQTIDITDINYKTANNKNYSITSNSSEYISLKNCKSSAKSVLI